jgi:hypothetical protein
MLVFQMLAVVAPRATGVLLSVFAQVPTSVPAGGGGSVTLNPTGAGMPGATFAQTMLNWIGQIALWGSLASILIGAAIYGLSQHVGNSYGASKGRVLALAGAIGAGLTGLAPTIVNLVSAAAKS